MKGSNHEVGGSVWSWRSPSGLVVSVVLVGGRVHLSPPQAEMQKWIRCNNSTLNPLSSSSCSSLHTCHILYKVSKKIKQNTEKSSPVQTIDFFHVKLSCFFFLSFSPTLQKFWSIVTSFWWTRPHSTYHCGQECCSKVSLSGFIQHKELNWKKLENIENECGWRWEPRWHLQSRANGTHELHEQTKEYTLITCCTNMIKLGWKDSRDQRRGGGWTWSDPVWPGPPLSSGGHTHKSVFVGRGVQELIVLPLCRFQGPHRTTARPAQCKHKPRSRPRCGPRSRSGRSGGEGRHLQWDALPQLLGLLASLQVLQDIVELHHAHRRQAEGSPGATDNVDEVVVVGGRQVDEPVVDVLQVGLLAALDELVERRRSKVGVNVGGVQSLQSFHDDLLQDKWTEDTFGCSHTELVHIVHS